MTYEHIIIIIFLIIAAYITIEGIDILRLFIPCLFRPSKQTMDKLRADMLKEADEVIKARKDKDAKLLFYEKIGDTSSSIDEIVDNLIEVLKKNNVKIRLKTEKNKL